MLEADAHNCLKHLLIEDACSWPHTLTLSRLIGRSLRRGDKSLIQLEIGSRDSYLRGLLIPIGLHKGGGVLVLTERQRISLLRVELPRLKKNGFELLVWEGPKPPTENQWWLLDHFEFLKAYENGFIHSQTLIFLEADFLSRRLREVMGIEIISNDWEELMQCNHFCEPTVMQFYERLTRRIFSNSTINNAEVKIEISEMNTFLDLLEKISPLPYKWKKLVKVSSLSWTSWAKLNHKKLSWNWNWQPLEPLNDLREIFLENPFLMMTESTKHDLLITELNNANCLIDFITNLGSTNNQEPVTLFAPPLQPLPNNELFGKHLLNQCRRLILGRLGITVILLDDSQLRRQLATELAAELGKRVTCQASVNEPNGVILSSYEWWISSQDSLPIPEQLIFGILPFPSLENPLNAARVNSLKRKGEDWFRKLLLPEALFILLYSISSIRDKQVRIAILDGRIRARSWGSFMFRTLEPWIQLDRLMPD